MKKIVMKMKKKENKKKSEIIRPPTPIQKPIRPKPEFDYLSVYPTFNHIFSVMYLKPQSQAVLGIPLIMNELKNLFTAHSCHLRERTTYQPAVFLPFNNNYKFSDPKQLVMQAESTHVDL